MVCGIGESPCDIKPYRGALWIASWVDHAVRQYQLVPEGASFRATRATVVQGNTDFRPVGLAPAPDGSLYISDWVDRSYPVHGKGRIWRLSSRDLPTVEPRFPAPSELEKRAEQLRSKPTLEALSSSDPTMRQAAIFGLAQQDSLADLDWRNLADAGKRLGILEALRWREEIPSIEMLDAALSDPHDRVRIFAARWIAERGLREHRQAILRLLGMSDISAQEYLVYLAAADWLDRASLPGKGGITEQLLAKELLAGDRPPSVQSLILRLLPPDHECLTPERLRSFFGSDNATLRLEAVRTLSLQSRPNRFATLAEIAGSDQYDQAMRMEAIMGLASGVGEYRSLLHALASEDDPTIQQEAARALRLSGMNDAQEEKKPPATDIDAWLALVKQPGDPDSGRRLFFSPGGPLCFRCHRFDGRGGTIGPDLTRIGQQQSPRRILTSILQPSNEIDLQYTPWILVSEDGKVYTGLPAPTPGDTGIEKYHNSKGELFALPSHTIESRTLSDTSIMPDGLNKRMTIDDLRDLIGLLTSAGL
jgi:hypothetical protein